MADRNTIISEFLAASGWKNAIQTHLAGDASFRGYQRISLGQRRAILMNSPPDKENVVPFVFITKLLRSLGYSAPEIYAKDMEAGLILLEDFGDTTFTVMISASADEKKLYECAIDLLIDLHSRPQTQTIPPGLHFYDNRTLIREALLLTDWYIPQVAKNRPTDDAKIRYEMIWENLLPLCHTMNNTLVLRDFHADNLTWLPDRIGVAACGLLDYQDAVSGPPTYDLMSLLEDARRDLNPNMVKHLRQRYLLAFPDLDPDDFRKAFVVLAAQRHCKVIGIFSRLAIRDNKTAYLSHIPRVWQLLEEACSSPILLPLKIWLDRFIKPELRGRALLDKFK